MKLKLVMIDANEVKTTKTFTGIDDNTTDAKLKEFGAAYVPLTNDVEAGPAYKITESELSLYD